MDALKAEGFAAAQTAYEAPKFFDTGKRHKTFRLTNPKSQATNTITALLAGSNTCTAAGMTASGSTPVLDLCRKLIAADFDPALPLHAYRGEVLCLVVRSIGKGAALCVNSKGTGFISRPQPVRIAPPLAPLDDQAISLAGRSQ